MQAVLLGSSDLCLFLKHSMVKSTQATSGIFSTSLLFSIFLKHDLTKNRGFTWRHCDTPVSE
jgi:hypothetical protein